MKSNNETIRIRNTPEGHIYGRMRQNSGGGAYLPLLALVIGGVLLLLISTPGAAAQEPTVTPWPGPAATATAAAQAQAAAASQRNSAAQMQAQAAQQRAQADALAQQANAAAASADASYNAAQQAASDARAALAAQQAGAAGEAIGRAEANISEGRTQTSALKDALDQMRGIYDLQAGQLLSVTLELQQAQQSIATVTTAYHAAIAEQENGERSSTLLKIFGSIVALAFVGILIAFAASRLRARAMATDDAGEAGDAEIIDQE